MCEKGNIGNRQFPYSPPLGTSPRLTLPCCYQISLLWNWPNSFNWIPVKEQSGEMDSNIQWRGPQSTTDPTPLRRY